MSAARERAVTAAAVVASAAAMTLWSQLADAWFWCGWVGLAPWLAALDRARGWRAAACRGLAMCVAFTLGLFWWFGVAVSAYAEAPRAAGLFLLVLGAPLLQPQFIALALGRHAARRRGRGPAACAAIGAGAYLGAEWLFPKLLADTIGHGFLLAPLMRQAADLVGAPGLSLVLLLANDTVLAVARALWSGNWGRALRATAMGAGLLAALLGYGAFRLWALERATADVAPLTVGVVQGGLGDYASLREAHGSFEATRRILNDYMALSDDARSQGPVQLLVWPETVYPTTFGSPKSADGAAFDRALGAFVAGKGVPLVFGGYDAGEDGREYNAAIVLEPPRPGESGVSFDAYRKTWLFPLTERVPAWLDTPALRRRLPWLGTWTPGGGPMVLQVRPAGSAPLRLAPLVCYDAVVPSHAAAAVGEGAELLVTLSNDAWFGRGPGTWLHLAVSAFRSIETRRPQLRATTTGISAIIDASGELRLTAGPGERRALVAAVRPAALPPTLVMRFGDWLSPAVLALAIVLLLVPQRSGSTQKAPSEKPAGSTPKTRLKRAR